MASNEIRILEERIRHLEQQLKLQQVQFGKLAQSVFDNSELRNLKDMNEFKSFGRWQSWTPTLTGWDETPGVIARYSAVGKICFWSTYISGKSNATTASITLPFTSVDVANEAWGGANNYAVDGGTALSVASRWTISANSNTVNFYTNMASGAWIASGTKSINASGWFEIA